MPGPTHAPPPGELIAAAFGLGPVREPPRYAARGELGHVWHLGTTEGEWAIKALIQPVDELTGDDLDYQLALHDAGVPLPRPVRPRAGGAVVIGPDGAGYRAYEWLELDPGRHVDVATAGRLLARIQALAWPADGVHPWFCRAVPDRTWPELVARGRHAGVAWAEPLASRVDAIVAPRPWSPASHRRGSSAAISTSTRTTWWWAGTAGRGSSTGRTPAGVLPGRS